MSWFWVTGAAEGIGKAIVKKLIKEEHPVIASSRNPEKLRELDKEISAPPSLYRSGVLDVRKPKEVQAFVKHFGSAGIGGLINNAGISSFRRAEDDTIEIIDNVIQTNLLGAVYCIQAALPLFKQQQDGIIVNILSIVNKKVFTNASVYSASKLGLEAYANVLREEVRKDGIKVLNVFPGATKTSIWSEDVREKHGEKMMSPESVAEVVYRAMTAPHDVVPEEIMVRPQTGDL